ncbi:unnamed protein product [Discula destructiva]
MSSQAPRNGERYHQDFIARIRYSNALPPPPNPPKLIDIPNTGLASGQYTTPGFATRLQREQPLNIEADAELGMPLDLVGMPGVFDGDEGSIQAPLKAPQVHPHDRALLKPLATLGKPQVSGTSVSFLRRTEYISNANTSKVSPFHRQPSRNNSSAAPARPPKRKSPEPEAGTPEAIRRKIDKGFEVALENLKDTSRIRHPAKAMMGKNKDLKVVEAFPILPDVDAFPDSGAYITYKFAHAPTANNKEEYDRRLQSSIMKFKDLTPDYQQRMKAHERDPANHPKPQAQHSYEMYLAETPDLVDKFRPAFDMRNPKRDEVLGPDGSVMFMWARSFVATIEAELDHPDKYSEEIALALDREGKTAWYYPVMQRTRMDPPRRILHKADQRDLPDFAGFDFSLEDPNEEFSARIEAWRKDPRFNVEAPQGELAEDGDASQSGHGSPRRDDSEEPPTNRGREESEQDAEGDEDY